MKRINLKKTKRMLSVMLPLCLISLIMAIWVWSSREGKIGEFVPPEFESSAQAGLPDVPEELYWKILDASVFRVGVCGRFCVHGERADVWLYNPEDNNVWIKLRVLDENGKILGETGLMRPGEYVQSVRLDSAPKEGSRVVLKVMTYEPETYYSAGAVDIELYSEIR